MAGRKQDGKAPKGRRPGWSTDAQEIVDRVFVYGTLRKGQTPRSMIEAHIIDAVPARMRGRLIAFPDDGYPGFLEGDDEVVGEILFLGDLPSALALLDAYEGSEYVRLLKKAQLENGTEVWAWVYALANPARADEGVPIPSADWLAFLGR